MPSRSEPSFPVSGVTSPAPFSSLLCAVDFSSVSEACLGVARSLVREGGTVHLVHVARPVGAHDLDMALAGLSPSPRATLPASPEEGSEATRARLETLAAGAGGVRGVRTEAHLAFGEDSAASISELARSLRVEAVVVGTHGRLGFGSVLLGSVASQVAEGSSAPVFVVFPGRERARGRALLPPYRSILCPTALSAVGNEAVPLAFAFAAEGSTVHLLHVWSRAGPDSAREGGERSADARRALEALAAATSRREGVRTQLHLVEDDDAAETIARAAATVSADLVVLGTHGRPGLQRVLVGTVASRTIRTGTPVLLVPRLSPAR